MNPQLFPIYRRAVVALLAICFVAFLMTSCGIYKCPSDGFGGYADVHGHTVKGATRKSY